MLTAGNLFLIIMLNSWRLIGKVICVQPKVFFEKWTYQKTWRRYCSVRRALLGVPGSDSVLLNNAVNLRVDSLILDCEKDVAADQKEEARENIRNLLDIGPMSENDPEWCVRVNPVQTPELCEADIAGLLSARNLPRTIYLSKVKNVNQLEWFTEKVWKTLLQRPEHDRGPLNLILNIDSGIAMLRLEELCQKAEDLATMAPILPVALVFDGDSVADSIGAKKSKSGIEVLYAKQKLVFVAKAFGLQAIDKPFLNTKNFEELKESCLDGIILGYTGKQVIHVDQIIIVQEEFTPSRSKLHWAKTVLKTFRETQKKAEMDLGFENALIDNRTVKQAKYIIHAAVAAGIKIDSADSILNELALKE